MNSEGEDVHCAAPHPTSARLLTAPHPQRVAAGGQSSGRLAPKRSGSQSSRPLHTSPWPSPGHQTPLGSRQAAVNKPRAQLLSWSGSPPGHKGWYGHKDPTPAQSSPRASTGSWPYRVSQDLRGKRWVVLREQAGGPGVLLTLRI